MKLFIDTGSVAEVEEIAGWGILSGATTNPSLLAKEDGDPGDIIRRICDLVDGPVSAEVVSDNAEGMVAEGRQILRNIQRVARLFTTKTVFTALVGLAVGIPTGTFPLLPRQFTIASTVTIGIPAFVLALARSRGTWRPDRFLQSVARFAIPARNRSSAVGFQRQWKSACNSPLMPSMNF